MPIPDPTVDEIIAVLNHSDMPAVLVEGPGDTGVYRYVEDTLGIILGLFVSCGGRIRLLEVYARRAEIRKREVVFLADKDLYIFTAIPADLEGIVWTQGYCIENDVYSESQLDKLLRPDEKADHAAMLDELCRWFAFEVEEHLAGRGANVGTHVARLFPLGSTTFDQRSLGGRQFNEPGLTLFDDIKRNYELKVRGKQLFQLLLRFLSHSSRDPKYSCNALLEIACKTTATPQLMTTVNTVRNRMSELSA